MRYRPAGAALAVSLCAGLAACTGGGDQEAPQSIGPASESSSTATTSGTASTTAPKPDQTFPAEQQPIIDAYYGFYDALFTMSSPTSDEIESSLSPFAGQDLVDSVKDFFAGYAESGKAAGGFVVYSPIQVTLDGENALVTECRDGSTELAVDAQSGAVLGTGSPGTQVEAQLTRNPTGTWIITVITATENAC